ncbi:MAG: hypothetical protein SGPRY_009697, partial [Prymnesium sp.]
MAPAAAFANAAEHLRHASLVGMNENNMEPLVAFFLTVPKAARDMPNRILERGIASASRSARASMADKRAVLRVMIKKVARES